MNFVQRTKQLRVTVK